MWQNRGFCQITELLGPCPDYPTVGSRPVVSAHLGLDRDALARVPGEVVHILVGSLGVTQWRIRFHCHGAVSAGSNGLCS